MVFNRPCPSTSFIAVVSSFSCSFPAKHLHLFTSLLSILVGSRGTKSFGCWQDTMSRTSWSSQQDVVRTDANDEGKVGGESSTSSNRDASFFVSRSMEETRGRTHKSHRAVVGHGDLYRCVCLWSRDYGQKDGWRSENGIGYDFACSEYRKTALNEEIAVVRVSGIMPAGDASIRGLFCEVVSVCLSVQILIPLSHLSLVYICKIHPSNTPILTTCPLMALAPAPCMPQS